MADPRWIVSWSDDKRVLYLMDPVTAVSVVAVVFAGELEGLALPDKVAILWGMADALAQRLEMPGQAATPWLAKGSGS